jgi:hypothetical protein
MVPIVGARGERWNTSRVLTHEGVTGASPGGPPRRIHLAMRPINQLVGMSSTDSSIRICTGRSLFPFHSRLRPGVAHTHWLRADSSEARVEKHVGSTVADWLVTPQQSFSFVAGGFSRSH